MLDQLERTIHPNDDMLVTMSSAYRSLTAEEAQAYYFRIGARALQLIEMARAIAEAPEPQNILDLPCGYGRVMRHLRARFPAAKLHACELNREGVDFCAEVFDAVPIYSTPDPLQLELPTGMDLVWVGSLLTHLSEEDAYNFLDEFERALAPGGILCFTLHGRRAHHLLTQRAERKPHVRYMLDDLSAKGWAFRARHGRYGGSYTAPRWVASNVFREGWRVLLWSEGGWSKQDFIAVQKV